MDADSIGTCGEEEIAAMGDLERATLVPAETKDLLELFRLARALGAEEGKRRVGGHDRPLIRREKIARILGCEDERTIVLANSSSEADYKPPDGRILEEQAELVNYQHAAAVLALDARPQRLGEQEVNRRDHLVAELAHPEGDDRRLK